MNGLLTFLLDRDDLACLEALCPAALSGTIVAFDPDLHIELLSREVVHVTPWSFVGSAELDAVRDVSVSRSRSAGQSPHRQTTLNLNGLCALHKEMKRSMLAMAFTKSTPGMVVAYSAAEIP